MEGKVKLLQEKNKTLFTEVVTLRKEHQSREVELEKLQQKCGTMEKQVVMAKKQQQQAAIMSKVGLGGLMLPIQNNGQVAFGTYGDYFTGGQNV